MQNDKLLGKINCKKNYVKKYSYFQYWDTKVRRPITKLGAIEKSPILLWQKLFCNLGHQQYFVKMSVSVSACISTCEAKVEY